MNELLRFRDQEEGTPVSDEALALKKDTTSRYPYLRVVDTSIDQTHPQNVTLFEARKEQQRSITRKVVQYEVDFDLNRAQELRQVKITEPERYQEEEMAFEGFIKMQLLTALGERYNRGISEFSYRAMDGKLVGEHSDEPFEDILERGRAYREEHGDPIDHLREAAEVVGFQKMQEVMANEETPAGTVMLTVSPPGGEGSIYKHNFYDGYRKNEDGSIQAIRFSSALTPEETIMKLWGIDPTVETPEDISDVSLLSHPILLTKKLSLDEIHQKLHTDHEVLSEAEWEEVKEIGEMLGTSYIATLLKDPYDDRRPKEIYNAMLNLSDDAVAALKDNTYDKLFDAKQGKPLSENQFYALAYRPVRHVDTGCGFSGGMELGGGMMGMSNISAVGPYSVGEFSLPDFSFGERKLKCKACPVCKAKDIVATIANGKITCPECKASEKYDC